MELLLIRHALPMRRELDEGPADPELSEAGRHQALHLGEYLRSEHLDAVYASPMKRARQTADPVAEGRAVEVRIRDGIAEFDHLSSEYVPVEELKAAGDPRWRELLDGVWGADESPAEFHGRVLSTIDAIIDDHASQRVAVVCHGGVINAYLGHVLGLDPLARGFFYPNYTSIHRVAASSKGDRSVVTVNETSHLRNTGLPMGLFQKG